ncbi:hypothetical protein TBLA_0J01940 [Henningerozyma blattae CBS 6284]|uniref:BZIP domain-containing protein n=1 Tax=Henningerozyma blattae (strain ATCC 34711 / CBS 6284 / DSM 70876 / NBRC 10599 / NRRL Y-10934 / UCD 77-7) TaxID=1071380 RepID=I2H9Y6_HENB6|nr:hypothetical protein TBLA_0J01940 [Tetrapisispora blattae CBS 6284]CCH63188.1 hypothetical protein TBLA_0J01940 [Tetrapisispora blattae CBS 6284]
MQSLHPLQPRDSSPDSSHSQNSNDILQSWDIPQEIKSRDKQNQSKENNTSHNDRSDFNNLTDSNNNNINNNMNDINHDTGTKRNSREADLIELIEKKKRQNREAQRAYRERRANKIQELEGKVRNLQEIINNWQNKYKLLESKFEFQSSTIEDLNKTNIYLKMQLESSNSKSNVSPTSIDSNQNIHSLNNKHDFEDSSTESIPINLHHKDNIHTDSHLNKLPETPQNNIHTPSNLNNNNNISNTNSSISSSISGNNPSDLMPFLGGNKNSFHATQNNDNHYTSKKNNTPNLVHSTNQHTNVSTPSSCSSSLENSQLKNMIDNFRPMDAVPLKSRELDTSISATSILSNLQTPKNYSTSPNTVTCNNNIHKNNPSEKINSTTTISSRNSTCTTTSSTTFEEHQFEFIPDGIKEEPLPKPVIPLPNNKAWSCPKNCTSLFDDDPAAASALSTNSDESTTTTKKKCSCPKSQSNSETVTPSHTTFTPVMSFAEISENMNMVITPNESSERKDEFHDSSIKKLADNNNNSTSNNTPDSCDLCHDTIESKMFCIALMKKSKELNNNINETPSSNFPGEYIPISAAYQKIRTHMVQTMKKVSHGNLKTLPINSVINGLSIRGREVELKSVNDVLRDMDKAAFQAE